MKSKPKTVFALVLTQKLILLRCFPLAFDKRKTRLKKGLKKCQICKNRRLRDRLLFYTSNTKIVLALESVKEVRLLQEFLLALDHSKTGLKKGGLKKFKIIKKSVQRLLFQDEI